MIKAKYTLSALTATRDRIAAKVAEGPDAVYLPVVNVKDNRVEVFERGWVRQHKLDGTWEAESGGAQKPTNDPSARRALVDGESARADSAVAAEGPAVIRRPLAKPYPLNTPYVDWGYCHPLYCSRTSYGAFRGGLRLDVKRDDGSWGGCTSGFNMRSYYGTYASWPWVLTAGHCVVGKTNNEPIQHNGYNVFQQHGFERNSYPYDYAVLPYNSVTAQNAWLENFSNRNRVMVYCRSGGLDSDSDTPCSGSNHVSSYMNLDDYISYSSILVGYVVCASGTGSNPSNYPDSYDSGAGAGYLVGTRCGRVTSFDGGIVTDICARAGDSGGPLFNQVDHKAYGILEGSIQHRSGACQIGEYNNYSPISKILTDVNSGSQNTEGRFGSHFQVITGGSS